MSTDASMLESFEHVVVLMLENRSFDNILGYLYPDGVPSDAPLGKTFEGVSGRNLSNPDKSGTPIPVSRGTDYRQPYPDPGEEYRHVNEQLFGSSPPDMQGFVVDYYNTLEALTELKPERKAWPGSPSVQSKEIMKCFDPAALPVLSALATEFAVFDHWFCAVPSQTWCNRAFWHAATSWGWVNNPPIFGDSRWNYEHWRKFSAGKTLFDLIENKFGRGSWHVYEDLIVAFTKLIHWGDLKDKVGSDYFRYLEAGTRNFFTDCRNGELPKYSFLEPHFIDYLEHAHWHDDMHPSSWDSIMYKETGPGSVLLGDQLVWKVYQAIRNSDGPNNSWQNTLLIITFDEHGGCFDHVLPPPATPPDAKGFNTGDGQCGFDFTRLGVRVPMVMVSAHIEKNTIVNSQMQHDSFLRTMQQKWSLDTLGPRQNSAPLFTEVFTSSELRTRDSWPDWESYPGPTAIVPEVADVDQSTIPLNDLQKSILEATRDNLGLGRDADGEVTALESAADARQLLQEASEKSLLDHD